MELVKTTMTKEEMFKSAYGEIPKELRDTIMEVYDKLSDLQTELSKKDIPIRLCAKTNSLLERYPENNQLYFKNTVNALFNYGINS